MRHPHLVGRALDETHLIEESLRPNDVWRGEVPVATTVRALVDRPPNTPLGHFGPEVESLFEQVRQLGDAVWVGRYLRLALLVLLVRTLARPAALPLPPSVDALLAEDLTRILDEPEPEDGWQYKLAEAKFDLDFALAGGFALPFGLFVGEAPCWVARRALGELDLATGPWLGSHVRWSMRHEFTWEGRARAFQREAEFLAENPELLGLWAASWFYDPVVAEISPHLAYLRDQVTAGGAELFPLGSDANTIALATATSRTRRRLYEEGRYVPCDYALVWRSADMQRWAEAPPDP